MFSKFLKYSPYIVLLAIFIFIWRLNSLTPLWADDYCRLSGSTSIFEAAGTAFERYFTWSGRFFVMVINYVVFGNYPGSMVYFNLINSLFFSLLVCLIFILAHDRKPQGIRDSLYILLIFNLIFIGTKAVGEVALWKTGSIGYLWGATLELAVLVPFFSFIRKKNNFAPKKFWIYGYYLLCFIAATFLEHMSLAISAVTLYICLEHKLKKKSIQSFLFISAGIHAVGSMVLVLSKGNFARALLEKPLPLSERIVQNVNLTYLEGSLGLIFLFFLVIALANKSFIEGFASSIIWPIFAMAALTILGFSLSPTEQLFNFRIAFPLEIFMIIMITHLAGFLPKIRIFEITLFLILVVNGLGHAISAYQNSALIDKQISQRDALIARLREKGEGVAEFDRVYLPNAGDYGSEYVSKYIYISDVTENASHWKNVCFAQAFDLKEVISNP